MRIKELEKGKNMSKIKDDIEVAAYQCHICKDLKKPCTIITEEDYNSIPVACLFDLGFEANWKEIKKFRIIIMVNGKKVDEFKKE